MKALLIGDIHGDVSKIPWDSTDPIIQIGDFGFKDAYYQIRNTPQSALMIVGGNHDEYPVLKHIPAYLGDFGIIPGTKQTFFCRGAYSIDRAYRTPGFSWWEEEELTHVQADKMLDAYEQCKPEIMITHDCPGAIKYAMFQTHPISSRTDAFLNAALSIHTPKIWIFGHWHISKEFKWGDTCTFRCLAEGECLELELP